MLFQFRIAGANGARFVESVTTLNEQGTWRVAGSFVRPLSDH
jgi:hypothetical protein